MWDLPAWNRAELVKFKKGTNMRECAYRHCHDRKHCPECSGPVLWEVKYTSNSMFLCEAHAKWMTGPGVYVERITGLTVQFSENIQIKRCCWEEVIRYGRVKSYVGENAEVEVFSVKDGKIDQSKIVKKVFVPMERLVFSE